MISQFDHMILEFISNHLRNNFFDWFFPLFTSLGNHGIIYIATSIAFLFFQKTRRAGILMIIFLVAGTLVCNVWLKPTIARGRPFTELTDYVLLVTPPSDFSFPSGHTIAAFEAAFAVALLGKKPAFVAYFFAILMAFSRLYLYVHWPSDVIGGAVLGTVIPLAVYGIYRMIEKKRKKKDTKSI